MQTRVAVMSIIVEKNETVQALNTLLSEYGEYIIGRIHDIHLSSNVEVLGNTVYINGVPIVDDKIYTFACVDYLYDRDEEIYEAGTNVQFTGILVRDVMVNALKNEPNSGKNWLE